MNLLWIDAETGGLDPTTSSPIEICVAETTRAGEVIKWYQSKIYPSLPVHPEAAKVNGYTAEQWADAPLIYNVCQEISKKFKIEDKYQPAGWNIWFDLGFWKQWMYSTGVKMDYHPFDLLGACMPEMFDEGKLSLDKAYQHYFKTPLPRAHSAAGDVEGMLRIYNHMVYRGV